MLDVVEISSIWSQVTPQAESIEMVQYAMVMPVNFILRELKPFPLILSESYQSFRALVQVGIY